MYKQEQVRLDKCKHVLLKDWWSHALTRYLFPSVCLMLYVLTPLAFTLHLHFLQLLMSSAFNIRSYKRHLMLPSFVPMMNKITIIVINQIFFFF